MKYKAKQMSGPEGAEFQGQIILDYSNNLAADVTGKIFAEFGLHRDQIDPQKWYSIEIINQVYRAIYQAGGGSNEFIAIGKKGGEQVIAYLQPKNPEEALLGIEKISTSFIRNAPEGYGFLMEKVGDKHYRCTNNTNAPNDYVYGFLWELMRLTHPAGGQFRIAALDYYDQDTESGATFEIGWD